MAFNIEILGTFQVDDVPLETLFFQSGYLTIKEYDERYDVYRLTYPNAEIKQSMMLLELGVFTGTDTQTAVNKLYHLRHALENNNVDSFAQTIRDPSGDYPILSSYRTRSLLSFVRSAFMYGIGT